MAHVLLIEDDEQIASSLTKVLVRERHRVERAPTATAGLSALVDDKPEVIVLDLGLPDIDGLEVIRMIRGLGNVPVIVATARDDEQTIVEALDRGADDYVVKPYSGRQLDARIRALLRRSGATSEGGRFEVGALRVDVASHSAWLGDERLDLRPKEFQLLSLLASRAGEIVSRGEIAREVWDDPYSASDSTIDVHVSALRRRLGETATEPRFIRVVRGVGVGLASPDES